MGVFGCDCVGEAAFFMSCACVCVWKCDCVGVCGCDCVGECACGGEDECVGNVALIDSTVSSCLLCVCVMVKVGVCGCGCVGESGSDCECKRGCDCVGEIGSGVCVCDGESESEVIAWVSGSAMVLLLW